MRDYVNESMSERVRSLRYDPETYCLFWRWWVDDSGRARMTIGKKKVFVIRALMARRFGLDYDDKGWKVKKTSYCHKADCVNIYHHVIEKVKGPNAA